MHCFSLLCLLYPQIYGMIYISKIFTHLKGGIYMPGFTTHYILGMKAYNDMPQNNLKFIIAKYRWLYQLGLQGPDMFFYNLPILRHRDFFL